MKLSSGDFKELVGSDRKFDLLVVGLQEVPRVNVRQVLQEVLEESRRYKCRNDVTELLKFIFLCLEKKFSRVEPVYPNIDLPVF